MLPPPAPVVVVRDDPGGIIAAFAERVIEYKSNPDVHVRIGGYCASACTLLTALPRSQVCVEPNTALGFHAAYTPADPKHVVDSDVYRTSPVGTQYMMRFYPPRVRAWIKRHGGLTANLIWLRGKELTRMFRSCEAA